LFHDCVGKKGGAGPILISADNDVHILQEVNPSKNFGSHGTLQPFTQHTCYHGLTSGFWAKELIPLHMYFYFYFFHPSGSQVLQHGARSAFRMEACSQNFNSRTSLQ
jgi:hypothetical protein